MVAVSHYGEADKAENNVVREDAGMYLDGARYRYPSTADLTAHPLGSPSISWLSV